MVMTAIRKNPYIIGRPVSEAELFFDRENLFSFLADSLPQAQVILLHGQRRIGKSSVLTQIPKQLQDEPHRFVLLSLEGKSQKTLAEVLHDLARDIHDDLGFVGEIPTIAELQADPNIFADRFLLAAQEHIGEKQLVLLLDEFDALGNYNPDAAATHLFPYLSEIIQKHKFLHIIPVMGRRLDDLPTLLGLFAKAPTFEIRRLNEKDTRELVQHPTKDVMFYEEGALQAIWEMTAGHPYFTQVLCFALFTQAREDDWWQITREDVHRAVDRALELGEGGLAWFWDGLPIPERVFFAAAAEVVDAKLLDDPSDATIKEGEPLALLEDSGIVLTDCLHKAQRNLLDWGYLKQIKRVEAVETVARGTYQVAIELVRRWLIQRHGIKQELWELQALNPEVKSNYETARELRQRGQFYQAIQFYEQVFRVNPNHIGTLFELGECLLDTKAYSRAIALYERAAQVDPLRARDGLIQSRLGHAATLLDRDQLSESERLIHRVLELEADNAAALELLEKINDRRLQSNRKDKSWGRFIPEWGWNLLGRSPESSSPDSTSPDNNDSE
jgi:tetratricopeptide (TPR) repeat protein